MEEIASVGRTDSVYERVGFVTLKVNSMDSVDEGHFSKETSMDHNVYLPGVVVSETVFLAGGSGRSTL